MASNAGDSERKVILSRLQAAARSLEADVAATSKTLRDLGLTAQADLLDARTQASLASGRPRAAEQIKADSAALQKENALREQGVAVEAETLDLLKAQTRERLFQEGLRARATTPSDYVLPGQQISAEQARLQRAAALRQQPTIAVVEQRGGAFSGLAGQRAAQEASVQAMPALAEQRAQMQEIERLETERLTKIAAYNQELQVQRGYLASIAEMEQVLAQRVGQVAARQQGQFGIGQAAALRQPIRFQDQALASTPVIGGALSGQERQSIAAARTMGEFSAASNDATRSSHNLMLGLQQLGSSQAEASTQMRRHGALTTEFISALVRGEVTVQEFGYQIGATIGKFAGWTVAASATYGALAAIVAIGKGAIDSSSGIQQLTRTIDNVNADKAAQQFRDLSRATNVSVKDSANAVFLFSRTFHDQNDAVAVAGLGLKAYILDQVAVQDSVKFTTALHQQFGLGVQQLRGYYDLLATGQREYNARLSVTIPLLTTAAGALRNAGTSANDAATIAIYAARVSQAPGPQLATAIARSAATFARKPSAQAEFEALGLPGQEAVTNYGAFLKKAIAASMHFTPAENSALAQAFGGPLLGTRVFSRLFNPQSAAVLPGIAQLTPGNTQGKLDEEAKKRLQQVDQQVTAIGHNLQRLGSALAESGALAPLGLFIKLLNQGLNDVTKLVEAFDKIPEPLRTALQLAVELRAVMLLTQRTQIGGSIAQATRLSAIPGFGPSVAQTAREGQVTATRTVLTETEGEIESSRRSLTQLSVTANAMRNAAAQLEIEMKALADGSEEQLGIAARHNAQMLQITAIEDQITAGKAKQVSLASVQTQLELELDALNNRKSPNYRSDASVLGRQAELDSLAGGTTSAAAVAGGSRAGATVMKEGIETGSAAGAKVMAESITAAGAESAGLIATAGTTAIVTGTIASIRGVLPSIGDLMKAGLIAFVGQQVAQIAGSTIGGHTGSTVASIGKDAAYGAAIGAVVPIPGVGPLAGALAGAAYGGGQALSGNASPLPLTDVQQVRDVNDQIYNYQNRRVNLYTASLQRLQRLYTEAEFVKKHFGDSDGQIASLLSQINAASQAAQARITNLTGSGSKDPFANFENLSPKDTQTRLDALSGSVAVTGDSRTLAELARGVTFAAANYSHSTTADAVKLVTDAEQKYIQAVNDQAKRFTDKAQLDQNDPSRQAADLQSARAAYTRALARQQQAVRQLEQSFAPTSAALATAETTLAEAHGQGVDPAIVQAYERQVAQLLNAKHTNDKKLADARKEMARIAQALNLAIQQLNQTAYQDQTARIDANLGIANASTQDKSAQLQNTLAADNQKVQLAARLFTTRSNEYKTAYAKALQDQQAVVDNQRAQLVSAGELKTSAIQTIGPSGDLARNQQDLANARDQLAFDRSHGADVTTIQGDQKTINDMYRTIAEAQQQAAQTAHQNAQAFIQARTAYQNSLTTDPVKQALNTLRGDRAQLGTISRGDFKTAQEYQTALLNQRAKINQDRTSVTSAIVQRDLSNLDFESHVQRIGDAQYIDGLKKILRMKNLSIQDRRNILTKIYDLENQSNNGQFDLTPGNVKLPTLYDVRRAMADNVSHGGVPAPQVTTNTHIVVAVRNSSDVPKVADAIGRVTRTNLRAAMRRAGMRGT